MQVARVRARMGLAASMIGAAAISAATCWGLRGKKRRDGGDRGNTSRGSTVAYWEGGTILWH